MEVQNDLTLDPGLKHLCEDRHNLKSLYRHLHSTSARTIFRQLTQLYFQSVRRPVTRSAVTVGICEITREQLEYAQMFDERLRIRVVGLLVFSKDVTVSLIENCIQSITVMGWTRADPTIHSAIDSKLH